MMEVSEVNFGDTHLATSGVGMGGLSRAEHHLTSCSVALAAPYSWLGFVPLGFPSVSSLPMGFFTHCGARGRPGQGPGEAMPAPRCLCPQES